MTGTTIDELPYRPDAADLFARFASEPWAQFLDSGRPFASTGRYDILVADPIATLVTRGAVSEIRPCIGDQEACLNAIVAGSHPQCAVNPTSGMEEIFGDALPLCTSPRRIAVIGAGPAGVVCATTAAQRGHQVTLFDRQPHLGGMLIPGKAPG